MGIHLMADAAGQQGLSPYHAMACNPSTMVDPLELFATGPAHEGMYPRKPGMAPVPLYYILLCTPPSKILDMMYGSVFYAADQKMEVVLSGLYADMAAHDAMIAKRYNAILDMVWQDAIAKTAGLIADVRRDVLNVGKSWYTGENDGSDKDELYTIFRIPGLSDEKVKEIAKKAGGQGIGGVECNSYSAYFIELLFNYLQGVNDDPNRNFKFFKKENNELHNLARNSVKYLAKIGFEVVLTPATETQVAAALNLGHPFYANSFVADGTFNGHRIVIFELGIHNTDHFQNYIKYYDPNMGIQTMYNFFYENNGEYKKGYYNYSYPGTSLIITGRTQP